MTIPARRFCLSRLLLLLFVFFATLLPRAAGAATRTVRSLADNGAAGTLRAEIALATVGDTITFLNGLNGTITLNGTELLVQKNLTIQGPGAGVITVSGNNLTRVLHFLAPNSTPTITVSLSGLKITGGNASSAGGGGIFNDAGSTLTVSDCTLSGNTASSSASDSYGGGGIYTSGAALTVNNCVLSGNTVTSTTSASGGGLYVGAGTVRVINSTLSGNDASSTTSGYSYAYGGGAYIGGGTLTISSSTLSGNSASSKSTGSYYYAYAYGGGVYASGGALTVSNSTFSVMVLHPVHHIPLLLMVEPFMSIMFR